jgi:hypothetical protein
MSTASLLTSDIVASLNIDFWRKLGYYEDFHQFIFKTLLLAPCTQEELLKTLQDQMQPRSYRLLTLVYSELIKNMIEADDLYLINSSKQLQASRSLKDKILIALNLKAAPQSTKPLEAKEIEIKSIHLVGEIVSKPATQAEDRSQPAPITGLRMNKTMMHLGNFSLQLPVLSSRTGIADYQLIELLEVMKEQDLVKQKELNYELTARGIDFYRMDDHQRINLLKTIAKRINAERS